MRGYNESNSYSTNKINLVKNNSTNNILNDSKKLLFRKINIKKNIPLGFDKKNKNKIKIHKLSILYSSASNSNSRIHFPKIRSSRISDYNNLSFKEGITTNQSKELSLSIFQNNAIDLVHNLNPDSNNNLVSNLLFKEQLKNKLESQIINFKFNKKEKDEEGEKNEETNKKEEKKEESGDEEGDGDKFSGKKTLKIKEFNIIEKELNNKLKEIKQDYIIKKQDKNELNNKCKTMLKEIDNIEYDIYFLDYKSKENPNRNGKLNELSSKPHNIIPKQNMSYNIQNDLPNVKKSRSDKNILNIQRRMSVVQNYFKNQKKRDMDKKMKQRKIWELKKGLKDLKIPLNSINNEINQLRNIEKSTKERLMKHYLELLYIGKEVRNEGLIWIIKKIWKLGENVPMSFMPTFLDFDSIKYLFNMAEISTELESTKKYINDIKIKLKEKVNIIPNSKIDKAKNKIFEEDTTKNTNNLIDIKTSKSSFLFKENNIFRKKLLMNSSSGPDLMKKIFNMENNLSYNKSENYQQKQNKSKVMKLSKIFEQKENNFELEKMPEVNEIKKLRKKVIILSTKIEEMKNKEIKRIFNEFIYNNYERNYHSTIDVVLGALIGENSRNIQVNNFNMYKKGHLEEIKNIRFYEYAKHV